VAVSELPGYPGRGHARQSRYVTADFPCESISTIDQNFTWAMPWLARSGTANYSNISFDFSYYISISYQNGIPYSGKFSLVQIFAEMCPYASEEIFAVFIFAE